MRKATQSKLDPHAEVLAAWFTPRDQGGEGLTLDQAVARLSERYSIKVSPSRLSQWWQQQQQRALQDKVLAGIATGAQLNKQIDAQFAKNPAPELEQLMRLFKTITLQLAVKGEADSDLLKLAGNFGSLILEERKAATNAKFKDRDLSIKERRIVLLEQKAAQFDQAKKTLGDAALTEEQKQQRIRQIFGLA